MLPHDDLVRGLALTRRCWHDLQTRTAAAWVDTGTIWRSSAEKGTEEATFWWLESPESEKKANSYSLNGFFFTPNRLLQIIFFPSKTTTVFARDLLSVPTDPPVTRLSFMAQGSVCYEIWYRVPLNMETWDLFVRTKWSLSAAGLWCVWRWSVTAAWDWLLTT